MAYSPTEQRYIDIMVESYFPTTQPKPMAEEEPSLEGMQLAAGKGTTRTDAPQGYGKVKAPTTPEQAAEMMRTMPLEMQSQMIMRRIAEDQKAGVTGAVIPKDMTMRQNMVSGMQQMLIDNTGMDNARARKLSETMFGGESSGIPFGIGLIDITPFVIPLATQEAGISGGEAMEAAASGEYGKAALKYGEGVLQSLDAVPGVALAVKGGKAIVKTLSSIEEKTAKDYLRKSDLKKLPENQRNTLIGMYDKALETKPQFDAIGQEIASQINGEYMVAPIKKSDRLIDKTLSDYNGDVTKVKDLIRSTIVVDTPEQATQVLDLIRQRFSLRPEGFRNLLDQSVDAPLGYRDAKMNVEINGMIAEIQVNYRDMVKAKDKLHPLYEELSKIERTIINRPDMLATSKELARIKTLKAEQKAGYDDAFSEAIKRSKLFLETGAPLRRAESGSNGLGGDTSQARQYGNLSPAPIETGMPSTSNNSASFENFISKTSTKSVSDLVTDGKGSK